MNVLKMYSFQLIICAFFFILNISKTCAISDDSEPPFVCEDCKQVAPSSTLVEYPIPFFEYRPNKYLENNVKTLENIQITVLDRNVLSTELVKWMVGMYLKGKGIATVEPGTFESMSSLCILDLRNNNIYTLKEGVFEGAPGLKILKLSNNNIYMLYDYSFKTVNLLQHLDLSNNKIRKIETKVFLDLKNLQNLQLKNNSLKLLDYNLFRNSNELKVLDLSFNGLLHTDYFEDINIMLKLRTLNLSHNLISKLPTFMKIRSLEVLSLSNNNFEDLNVAWLKEHYVGLKYIEIANNRWMSCERLRDIQEELMKRKVHFVKEPICHNVYFEKEDDYSDISDKLFWLMVGTIVVVYLDSLWTFKFSYCDFVGKGVFKETIRTREPLIENLGEEEDRRLFSLNAPEKIFSLMNLMNRL